MNTELPTPPPESPAPLFSYDARPKRGRVLAALLAGVLLAGAGVTWLALRSEAPAPAAAEAPAATPATAAPALASLEGTDPRVRELLRGLSGDVEFLRWLAADDLVRRLVSSAHAVAEGQLPRAQLSLLGPSAAFRVTSRAGQTTIAPQSYARYDGVARAFASIDAQAAGRVYGELRPLLLAAHAELAPPGRSLDQTLSQAIGHLTRVSAPAGALRVVPKGALYAYADPQLEALSPAQKALLRMGPDNMRRVQEKLRQLESALQLEASARAAQP
ncbi:DUF3014 domain-containing protein [Aggregicoccus sp. 17bor-14]|uniref:DUF3014 domain-containing protein n=1 Tax=Myxococcaceae TaxID=31 RepID=UPI00129C5B11|nr:MULTISPECIES: DUF3014 domain-containing protein [Myxococcaceae]MBF5046392.1 DUF3014 domain-containing protein [Simulacricoccus sp. 17bor-14]MRI92112.1 DUF3014 domain-containing protein [Aggregicoccus sp. 17bor-14]